MSCLVVVPTLNPGNDWLSWIDAVNQQKVLLENKHVDICVIDSGSTDETVSLAINAGYKVVSIDKASFNHGGTRQKVVADNPDYEFIVFLTQDAVLSDSSSLHNILAGFQDEKTAAVCGRQLPKKDAAPIEAHARMFNYPDDAYVRSLQDMNVYGLKTIFLSNSFAAYRASALQEVGGFPDDVIFGEDMYVAAKLLMSDYKIAYATNACVYHSHDYSFIEEFLRYFDMGVFHAREPWIRNAFGAAEREGFKFVESELKYLYREAFWLIPKALLRTVLRYMGFRCGLYERFLPIWLKRKFSMNSAFFNL